MHSGRSWFFFPGQLIWEKFYSLVGVSLGMWWHLHIIYLIFVRCARTAWSRKFFLFFCWAREEKDGQMALCDKSTVFGGGGGGRLRFCIFFLFAIPLVDRNGRNRSGDLLLLFLGATGSSLLFFASLF